MCRNYSRFIIIDELYFFFQKSKKDEIQNAELLDSRTFDSDLSANSNIDMILKSEKTQEKADNRRKSCIASWVQILIIFAYQIREAK